ncbi:efflux RND transporter periplasmic adaptor subunit [Labilibaculum sp. K2S]|uniref:efflux RND transporter periplasmic adaptor subunit n=1 Tax=Labilibaculum sp. K2S TaxID=3056386 RepID=UPI0025A39AE5|nr:efflux RND transporter periplasmic adaptor subunit [Labilibaculum sp. K2S]
MKLIKMVILTTILSVGIFACKKKEESKTEIIQPVKVYKVSDNSNGTSVKVFTGLVKESREVKLAFQIAGPLVDLKVNEGQFVEKGELVAVLNDRDYLVQLESANANFENAKLQAERYTALYEKKSTSKSTYDQIQAVYKLAKAQKEAAENSLKDTKIYAPFSGYVQAMYVENFEKIGAGQPIVSLLDLKNLEVTAALSENDFLQHKLFTEFSANFENFPNIDFNLKLIEIERKPNGDNFFRMRLKIDTQNKQIVPGMVASVTTKLKPTTTTGCKVPVESVFSKEGKSYVWVYNESTNCVKSKEVQMKGFDSMGMINIIKGISSGDLIVSAGINSLREGQKVKQLLQKSNSNIGGQL